jgi:endonuclease/exonuclease/phosphatase family metal-dependent hydrolase
VGALRATLATPSGSRLQVFVVHLDPFSAETREREIISLTELMAPYLQSPTVLMGDMNMTCLKDPANCREYQLLSQAGWQLVVQEKYLVIQIWTSPALSQGVEQLAFPGASFAISDHLPLGAALKLPETGNSQ